MNPTTQHLDGSQKRTKVVLFSWAVAVLFALSFPAKAQSVQHLTTPQPGGIPGWPVVTGVSRTTNGVSITWDGPSGYYQLVEKQHLTDSKWTGVGGATNLNRHATVPTNLSSAFFAVSGPSPHYVGSTKCTECHSPVVNTLAHTAHAAAFTNASFVGKGGQTNLSCISCHTVGFDLPTGFTSLAKTPTLAGVSCENCHGPASGHPANPADPTLIPRVEVASTMCGGCHTTRFAEWKTSEHTEVIANLNAPNQIDSCGRCHSGTARSCLVQGQALPNGDANLGIQCITCHDPHQTNGYPAQLRYPIASTNDYFMPTNGTFASHYNSKINVCGQCHNHAGASWTNSAAPPHYSPQYNMLLGTVGELDPPGSHYQPASHATLLTNQCVACHMQTTPFVSVANPGDTGHKFSIERYDVCLECHPFPELLAQFAQRSVSNRVQELKFDLNFWATNAAPTTLWNKYGNRSWEYTVPGELSTGGAGPTAVEQALIPANIQKARFDVYLVVRDQSLGIHNPRYVVALLDSAENMIYDALYP